MARPTSYTPDIAETILQRIMDGEMLSKICEEADMPTRKAFYGWIAGRTDLKDAYARARLAWADWWAERVLAISLDSSGDIFIDGAGKAMIDHANVQRARLQTDSIKWLVGKWAPRTYGERPMPDEEPKHLTISWEVERRIFRSGDINGKGPEPPRQITYQKPELPADLTEADWSIMLDVLELVKRTVPTNDDSPPEQIFGIMREALLAHFREAADAIEGNVRERSQELS
jgi:hypothetical protein